MAKVICVLYDDPVGGYPTSYARSDLPKLDRYFDGQTLPTPKAIDFKPGQLLGSVSGELGLRTFLEKNGHKLVVTADKDGSDSVLDKELPEAEIVISQPFWPAYMTAARIAKTPKLSLIITAGKHARSGENSLALFEDIGGVFAAEVQQGEGILNGPGNACRNQVSRSRRGSCGGGAGDSGAVGAIPDNNARRLKTKRGGD